MYTKLVIIVLVQHQWHHVISDGHTELVTRRSLVHHNCGKLAKAVAKKQQGVGTWVTTVNRGRGRQTISWPNIQVMGTKSAQ